MPASRDRPFERGLLERSQRLARLVVAAWPSAVERRLALGDGRYGDAWSERCAVDLVVEAAEEAEDLGAWSCLAAQRLAEADLSDQASSAIREMVARAMGAAAEAHAYLSAAETALRRASTVEQA